MAKLEDIDRATSQMLTGADVSELERLNIVGENFAFGSVPATVSSAGSLASIQAGENLARSQRTAQEGQASGQLLGLLLSKYLGNNGGAGNSGGFGSSAGGGAKVAYDYGLE
jgi:hypothetical protein